MEIIFVGISNKSDTAGQLQPFDERTPSGKIIAQIEGRLGYACFKTNIVPFTPVNELGKIRYPTDQEIKENIHNCMNIIEQKSPCIVFLLGKIVEKSVLKYMNAITLQEGIYRAATDDHILFLPVYHPSYIYTYRRKQVEQYIQSIQFMVEIAVKSVR